ncbi:hypothetical protein L3X38_011518 [Prunus dulcis]|uniref:Uncharacterized protein n=1 Tax=Prunus dulcis TaxID=3755 RepID=A0AAD4ZED8_PRUDU|nr:hypothetical protein L3X38_011518 [Prunus dulcis]
MEVVEEETCKKLEQISLESHFKCDLLLNNLCESSNAAILDARDKTILSCLERIVHASSTQMEQGYSSNIVRGRGISRVRGISRGRGNVAQATANPNSLQSMARGNGEGVRGISRGRSNIAQAPVYPNSQESVARGRGQGGPALDNISYDNNMASI